MADIAKYTPINGTTTTTSAAVTAEFKNLFSYIKTRRTVAFFMFAFVGFTVFLALNPSSNIFSSTSTTASFRSQSSSLFDYLFNNTSTRSNTTATQSNNQSKELFPDKNTNKTESLNQNKQTPSSKNTTFVSLNNTQSSVLLANQSSVSPPPVVNQNPPSTDKDQVFKGDQSTNSSTKTESSNNKSVEQKGVVSNSNHTAKASLEKKEGNGTGSGLSAKEGIENLIESLVDCDLFDGNWVKDDSYPLYKPGSCSFIDEQFSCIINGRPDKDFLKLKWKPKGCTLPRLNGGHMLDLLRGKRLVFVGDSLNRNMWESLVCILKNAAKKPENVYEAHGRHLFRGEASYSFVFKDYNFTIDFFVSPFLVREWEIPDKNGAKKETLRLDLVGKSSDQYKSADILIFNTGHWWTHEKTAKGKDYYQEGSHVYNDLNVLEAFRKALTTWSRWIDESVNPMKTMVFFRGYSASHFRGGQWNSGGACNSETEPIKNETYLNRYPPKMLVLEKVLRGMKTHVTYLNITRLTDFRKDGHPSVYRKHPEQKISEDERVAPLKYQDCSHWCLPGVPDSWNELLYAELLVKEHKMRQHQRRAR